MPSFNKSSSAATSSQQELLENGSLLGFAGGDTNLTRYVGNSPTNATDPSGLGQNDLSGDAVASAAGAVGLLISGSASGGGSGATTVPVLSAEQNNGILCDSPGRMRPKAVLVPSWQGPPPAYLLPGIPRITRSPEGWEKEKQQVSADLDAAKKTLAILETAWQRSNSATLLPAIGSMQNRISQLESKLKSIEFHLHPSC